MNDRTDFVWAGRVLKSLTLRRAIGWLLSQQNADGSDFVFALCGPIHFSWEHYRLIFPLLGLGRWSQVSSGKP